jgi:tetratricopeptide (TPR) repeat protein
MTLVSETSESQDKSNRHLAMGESLAAAGELAAAEASFRAAVAECPNLVTAHGHLGHVLLRQQRFAEAAECYRRILALHPRSAEAWYWLAIVARDQQQWDESIECLRHAIELKPGYKSALYQLGGLHGRRKQFNEAADCFSRLIECSPATSEAHCQLGMALAALRRFDAAESAFRQAIALKPDDFQSHTALGEVLADMRRHDEAKAHYREALRYRPDFAAAHNGLGASLSEQKQFAEAVAAYQEALRYAPSHLDALTNLGSALSCLGRLDEAETCHRRAIALQPDFAPAYNNLGMLLEERGEVDGAAACLRASGEILPEAAPVHSALGRVLASDSRFEDALSCFDRALAILPDDAGFHVNRALALLSLGRFDEGWREYEWRFRCEGSPEPQFSQPRWNGDPVPKATILLAYEQGLGDLLQFVRYAPLVKSRCARVIVESPRSMALLLASAPGVDAVVESGRPMPAFDYYVPLLSLPGVFGTTLETIPAGAAYLVPQPAAVARRRGDLGATELVRAGIAWQGNRVHPKDPVRSIPLDCFEPIARLRGVRAVSLQYGEGSERLSQASFASEVEDLGDRLGDFHDTAALVCNLDLVISCDSSPAHLAGALGVPVWVALAKGPDWRWLRDRRDSPWYPSMRLFRQPRAGDWRSVFDQIEQELAALVASRAARRES